VSMGSASPASLNLSCEDVCRLFPRRIKRLLSGLDLTLEELSSVKAAIQKQEWSTACDALLVYYQESHTIPWLRQYPVDRRRSVEPDPLNNLCAKSILDDTFTFQLTTGKVPRKSNGRLDWCDLGPKNDYEWTWFLNRHYHLVKLLEAYFETGQLSYVHCISQHLKEWVLSSPSLSTPRIWAQWRGLEVAYRMLHWPRIFYGLQQVDAFTPATRLLMLSSLLDHAYYLKFLHDWGDNWVFREMYGLASIAVCWPEFKFSKGWLTYAGDRLVESVQEQIYPDGVHKELTSHYHRIVLRDAQGFVDLLHNVNSPVPNVLKIGLEKMWSYLAYTLRPSGLSLLNNDSDQEDQRSSLERASKTYQREDWCYIASNGQKGEKPTDEASIIFPWAGHFVMRSAWDINAHWAFFDIGPLGVNYHIHQDKLHLSVSAYGRDLLVDSGRYSYVRGDLWDYFRNSESHNVILIDGQGQKNDVKQYCQPIQANHYAIAPDFDFVVGTCDRGFRHLPGHAIHTRAIVYLRGHYWVVIDQIETNKPRTLDILWHFHPDCTVALEGNEVTTQDENVGNLRIIPTSNLNWQVKIIKGQESPKQGWWSREYGHLCPNPTANYQVSIATSATFAWILFPAKGLVPKIKVTEICDLQGSIRLSIERPEHPPDEVMVQMAKSNPIELENGAQFAGSCAILRFAQTPLVAYGVLKQKNGDILVKHPS
jgi:Heparinase II/III N-terminus/Heparinase II/III-like protein